MFYDNIVDLHVHINKCCASKAGGWTKQVLTLPVIIPRDEVDNEKR